MFDMTVTEYISAAPDNWRDSLQHFRQEVLNHLPTGFEECISYGMIGYVVPHTLYPQGYHCDPALPLPFMSIAARKNTLTFYHMGLYASSELMEWFVPRYIESVGRKPDLGKSCVRFSKVEHIPIELLGQLVEKLSVKEYINLYESALRQTN